MRNELCLGAVVAGLVAIGLIAVGVMHGVALGGNRVELVIDSENFKKRLVISECQE